MNHARIQSFADQLLLERLKQFIGLTIIGKN
jgi:hypothetical protein